MRSRKWLGISLIVFAASTALACLSILLPIPESWMFLLVMCYPVVWVGIVVPLAAIAVCAQFLPRGSVQSIWLRLLQAAAMLELAFFIRITCIPMSWTGFGESDFIVVAFEVCVPITLCLGIAIHRNAARHEQAHLQNQTAS